MCAIIIVHYFTKIIEKLANACGTEIYSSSVRTHTIMIQWLQRAV